MAVNYDRSKTIICNTTKNYYPCADDLLLPKICRKKRMKAITCVKKKKKNENMPYPADWYIILVVYP